MTDAFVDASAASAVTEPHPPVPPPLLARTITLVVVLWYGVVVALNVLWSHASASRLWISIGCVTVLFAVQALLTSSGARRWPARRRWTALATQAVMTYVPFLFFGLDWGSMSGPLAGSCLLLLSGWLPWLLYAAIGAGEVLIAQLAHQNAVMTAYLTASTMIAGVILYGMTRLTDLITEVHRSRAELARMAVAQERLRFARDLHDLLGYSLSAITLQTELIYRLIPSRPEQARAETASVLQIARQALADVRLVARGYRDMSLAAEAASAAEILRAADIRAQVGVDCAGLHPVIDTVLATVLREGVTNVLRHSKAQHCSITAVREGDTVRLTLDNDGVPEQPAVRSKDMSGSGIGNLRHRVEQVGGRLDAAVGPDGRFRLTAQAPVRPIAVADAERQPARSVAA
ncbi:histidine kinase [Streptomyces fodineus]|uniref:Histidine kinase n=1 Tax=Streptomyces fodineus TaxID=1904616 RepID=A0A1D7YBC5_9ACTN|nr:histidine kinase [Streptomyces fodineus]AOR32927.1 histidine kinase [Streptomyces fodineus]